MANVKIYENEEIKNLIIEKYKEFSISLGRTPKQKDIKEERKINPEWIVTMHKINLYFDGMYELNEICGLNNYSNTKKITKKKKTHEEFVNDVNKIEKDKYEFLTEYMGSNKNITIKCKEDNYIWTTSANGFLANKCKCPKCSNRIQNKNTEYFKSEVNELWGDEYTVLGEYENCKTNILLRHNTCGNEFCTTPDSFLNKKTECSVCSFNKRINKLFLTHEQFLEKVKDVYGEIYDEYNILSQYKGYKDYVVVEHKTCGNVYEQFAGDILQGKKCKYCGGTLKKTQVKFEEEIFNLYNGEYSVIDEYINAKTPVLIKHNKCGRQYKTLPNSILKGHGCNCESITKGEYIIKNFLEFNKIKYKYQYKNELCKLKTHLPFDFGIFDNNKNIICLIEYDGEQHFRPVKFGGISQQEAEVNFRKTKIRDQIKTKFCEDNNIRLLRISYLDINNINSILLKYLTEYVHNKIIIPDRDVLVNQWSESKQIKLIELLKRLPNGIYPKEWVKDNIGIEKEYELSKILRKDIIKEFVNNNKIIVNSEDFTIINNYTDYKEYFQLISNYNNKNKHTVIKILRVLESIPIGKYKKLDIIQLRDINVNCQIASKYLSNPFLSKYIIDNKITIKNKHIIKE